MIILSKKRIMIVIGTVMIAMFAFIFQSASVDKTLQTVALPISNKVVVIDAGHGVPDERC